MNQEEYKKWREESLKAQIKLKESASKNNFDGPSPMSLRMQCLRMQADDEMVLRVVPTSDKARWFKYQSAWITTYNKAGKEVKREIISNSWNGEKPDPDVLYYYAVEEGKTDFLAKEKYAITVVALEDFYKIPRTSADGKREYIAYERSRGVDEHGRSLDPPEFKSMDKVFGRKFYLSLWPRQLEQLESEFDRVASKCMNCDSGNISVYAFTCPECDHSFGNHKDVPIPVEYEATLRKQFIDCPSCGKRVFAKQHFSCVKVEGTGSRKKFVKGCDNPTRLDITKPFDIVVKGIQSGKGVAYSITDFSAAEVYPDLPEYMNEPMPFDDFLGKMSLEEQSSAMGRKNPFDSSVQTLLDTRKIASPDEPDPDSIPWE